MTPQFFCFSDKSNSQPSCSKTFIKKINDRRFSRWLHCYFGRTRLRQTLGHNFFTRAFVGARVAKCKPFFFLRIWSPKGGSWSQAFLAETVETGHENLVNVLNNSARYSTMSKGKNMSNVLANGVIFSTLKHTDPHRARVHKNASRFFSSYLVAKRGSWSQAFLA